MDEFRIREEDLIECNRSLSGNPVGVKPSNKAPLFFIDYNLFLRQYFNYEKPAEKILKNEDNNDSTQQRQFYKDYVLYGKEMKQVLQ